MTDTTRNNYLKDTEVQFGDVPATYTEIVDLGKTRTFRGLMIYSSLDEPVSLKFDNAESDELNVPPNWEISPNIEFWHDGPIELKHNGDAPTEGFIKIVSWRAE